jgi:hypothetical protein
VLPIGHFFFRFQIFFYSIRPSRGINKVNQYELRSTIPSEFFVSCANCVSNNPYISSRCSPL